MKPEEVTRMETRFKRKGTGPLEKSVKPYSTNTRSAYGTKRRHELTPEDLQLERAKTADRKARFSALQSLRRTTVWLEADEEERDLLEEDTILQKEQERYQEGRSGKSESTDTSNGYD